MLSSSSSMKSCCSLGLMLSLSFSRSSFTSSSLIYLFRLFAIANALTSCSWLSSTRIADISSCSRSKLCLVFYSASFNLSFEFYKQTSLTFTSISLWSSVKKSISSFISSIVNIRLLVSPERYCSSSFMRSTRSYLSSWIRSLRFWTS